MLGHPFPLMGKRRDRVAQKPIKPIIPTFFLPRRGEGITKKRRDRLRIWPEPAHRQSWSSKSVYHRGRVSSEERRGVGDEPRKLPNGLNDSATRTLILNDWNVFERLERLEPVDSLIESVCSIRLRYAASCEPASFADARQAGGRITRKRKMYLRTEMGRVSFPGVSRQG